MFDERSGGTRRHQFPPVPPDRCVQARAQAPRSEEL
jgi:hypothetical protein